MDTTTAQPNEQRQGQDAAHHQGFTLVEILIAILIIGVLASVTVVAVRGITDRGEKASCDTDQKVITQAADVYFGAQRTDTIPAAGGAPPADRFEQTLVDAGYLKDVSGLHELGADGTITSSDSSCV